MLQSSSSDENPIALDDPLEAFEDLVATMLTYVSRVLWTYVVRSYTLLAPSSPACTMTIHLAQNLRGC